MTDSKHSPDGGPAFAAIGVGPAGDLYHQEGMSLRDWFAGQALAGLMAQPGMTIDIDGARIGEKRSGVCFAIADAMLAERSKAQDNPQ